MSGTASSAARDRLSSQPLRTERQLDLVVVLLGMALLLVLGLGVYLLHSVGPPEPVMPAADSLTTDQPLRPARPTQDQVAELRDRPLFWASRRPAPAGGVAEEKKVDSKAGEIDGIRLVGVFGSGDSAGIMVTVNDSARKRLQLGDKINGWKLEEVAGIEAILSAGPRRKTLVLGKAAKGKPANRNKRARRAR